MKLFTQVAIIAGLAVAGAGLTYLIKGAPERRLVCDATTLKSDEICLEQVPDGVVWVDARMRREWETSRAPGAILWNLDPSEDSQAFEVAAMSALIEAQAAVVYCSDENCGVSRQVAERIRSLGLGTEVKVLFGGWRSLVEAGRVRDSNPAP